MTAQSSGSAAPHLSDEALTARLREHGLRGPISAEFLAEYRTDVEFASLAARLEAVPGGAALFERAMARSRILPADDPGDARLLDAWSQWKAARASIAASGPDAPDEIDQPFWDTLSEAEEAMLAAVSMTKAGAIVKLRFALSICGPSAAWFDRALAMGDDLALFSRSADLDLAGRLICDALELLVLDNAGHVPAGGMAHG